MPSFSVHCRFFAEEVLNFLYQVQFTRNFASTLLSNPTKFSLQLFYELIGRRTFLKVYSSLCSKRFHWVLCLFRCVNAHSRPNICAVKKQKPHKPQRNACYSGCYHRLHLPVNALAQNMFSHDVKRLRFKCQTLKFSHPNVKFPRQSLAVITVKNVRQIYENPFTDILRAEKASRTSSEK